MTFPVFFLIKNCLSFARRLVEHLAPSRGSSWYMQLPHYRWKINYWAPLKFIFYTANYVIYNYADVPTGTLISGL